MSDAQAAGPTAAPAVEPSLHRVMGPWLLLLFIVGDILGTGIYALTGQVANFVGGVVWLPFLVAFMVALITAFSYLELVTKYPRAAGAALYVHKAFGVHLITFIVAFAVMCSGITSASTASRALRIKLTRIRCSWSGSAFTRSPSPTIETICMPSGDSRASSDAASSAGASGVGRASGAASSVLP